MIIFKLFMVLVGANGGYSLLNIGDHYFATEVECNQVGAQVATSYTPGQMVWFCEKRTTEIPEDDSKPL